MDLTSSKIDLYLKELFAFRNEVLEKRQIWNDEKAKMVYKTLEQIRKTFKDLVVARDNNSLNRKLVSIGFQNVTSDIRIGKKDIHLHGAYLKFLQSKTGDIIIGMYPAFHSDEDHPKALEIILIHPKEVTEELVIQTVEMFLEKLVAYEKGELDDKSEGEDDSL